MSLTLLIGPDSFSGWGRHDMAIHNREVDAATQILLKRVVPLFANYLASLPDHQLQLLRLVAVRYCGERDLCGCDLKD